MEACVDDRSGHRLTDDQITVLSMNHHAAQYYKHPVLSSAPRLLLEVTSQMSNTTANQATSSTTNEIQGLDDCISDTWNGTSFNGGHRQIFVWKDSANILHMGENEVTGENDVQTVLAIRHKGQYYIASPDLKKIVTLKALEMEIWWRVQDRWRSTKLGRNLVKTESTLFQSLPEGSNIRIQKRDITIFPWSAIPEAISRAVCRFMILICSCSFYTSPADPTPG
jgi:hypothetical protein